MIAYYHGGIAGLHPGDTLRPAPPHVVDGCPICVARAEGRALTVGEYRIWLNEQQHPGARKVLAMLADANDWEFIDPPSERKAVYLTTDLEYARWHAARSQGDLYQVRPAGEISASTEDFFPTWTCAEATVERVVERKVRLCRKDRRAMSRRWGKAERDAKAAKARAAAANLKAMSVYLRPPVA